MKFTIQTVCQNPNCSEDHHQIEVDSGIIMKLFQETLHKVREFSDHIEQEDGAKESIRALFSLATAISVAGRILMKTYPPLDSIAESLFMKEYLANQTKIDEIATDCFGSTDKPKPTVDINLN